MKFLIFTLLLLLTVTTFGQGILSFTQTTIEFKNLKADNVPTVAIFKFKNIGNQPIIITRVVGLSSFIQADWEKAPIAPGKTSEIKASFLSSETPEKFDLPVNVYSNAQPAMQQLSVKANIIENPQKPELLYKYNMQGVMFKDGMVAFDKVFTNQLVTDTVTFYNARKENTKLEAKYLPSYMQVKVIPESVAPGKKGMLIVSFNAKERNDYGYCYESILLALNGDMANYQNRLTLTASIVEDFSKLSVKELKEAPVAFIDKKEVNFGDIKEGEKANCDYLLVNKGKSDLMIRKTKAGCGCTAVTMGTTQVAPGQSTTIRATFDSSSKQGRQYKSVTIITNDPQNSEITVTLTGNVTGK